ncbi:TraI domain-containing protein [Salmonella enterica]|nr:TraI domain-containing protein [Salmonella enterica]
MAPVMTRMKTGRRVMLHKLFLWVTDSSAATKKTGKQELAPEARGYLLPQTVDVLLGTENRQKMLKQMRENSLLTKEATEKYYMQPLRHCVSLMQGLPATERAHHAVVGGLVDLTLKTVVCALRLSRGYMLPQGGSAEEQSAQAVAWNAVVFYAALCHSLPVFGQLQGELADGTLWYPGLTVPSRPYRVRFCQDRSNNVHAMATLLSMRLLPDEVVVWLGRTPAALDTLLNQIQGENRPACVVSQIISEAVRFAGGVPQEPQRRTSSDIQFAPGTAVVDVVAGSASGDAGNVLTSLGSALDESPAVDTVVSPTVTPVVVVPDNQEAKAVGDAMALMEFNTSESQVTEAENIPQPGDLVVVKAGEETARISDKKDKQKNCGEQFWRWLSDGIRSGSLSVNAPDSLVHITGGMIFIPTPEIFFAFLKKTPCSSPDINRDDIQREFEKLGRNFCKRDKSLFQCMKYEEERRQGRHKRWSGYLIMARKIYTDRDIPDDSMYLFVSMVG